RKLAMRSAHHFGSWHREAAMLALGGTDEEVVDYVEHGWRKAQDDENRQQVTNLSVSSPYEVVRTEAARLAADGTATELEDFLRTGRHERAVADYRVEVSKLHNEGGPAVQEQAEKVLAEGSPAALHAFLTAGQYIARNGDERVTASALAGTGGPEQESAARIALLGPADKLTTYLQSGQHMAERKDDLTATHVHQVQRMIAEGELVAAKARADSWTAAAAAAVAKGAASKAAEYAANASASAKAAEGHAKDARQSANEAATSAQKAAESATTARKAANDAAGSAQRAEESAANAAFDAAWAGSSAYLARQASDEARADAVAAGKSAEEAETLAGAAWQSVADKRRAELAEARRKAAEERRQLREEREKAAEKRPTCYLHMTRDSVPPCAMAGEPLVLPPVDPRAAAFVTEVLGVNEAIACAKDPLNPECLVVLAAALPPIRGLKAADNVIDAINTGDKSLDKVNDAAKVSRLTRIDKLKKVALDESGKPYGKPGKQKRVWIAEEGQIAEIADLLRSELGRPDQSSTTPKGQLEIWETPEGEVIIRNFSKTGGLTVQFTKSLVKETGIDRYHKPS
ncbi:hypothetical protein ACWEO9_18470, partial [Streptomyces albidoflavus]